MTIFRTFQLIGFVFLLLILAFYFFIGFGQLFKAHHFFACLANSNILEYFHF